MDRRRLQPGRACARVLVMVLVIAVTFSTIAAQGSSSSSSDSGCQCIDRAVTFCLPSGGVLMQRFADRHCSLGHENCDEGMTRVCLKETGDATTSAPS